MTPRPVRSHARDATARLPSSFFGGSAVPAGALKRVPVQSPNRPRGVTATVGNPLRSRRQAHGARACPHASQF